MHKLLIFLLLLMSTVLYAQPKKYGPGNLHSHNDYEKPSPFWEAYNQGFGSIEADIYLRKGNLVVAHDTNQAKLGRTLDSLYLQPLEQCIAKNNGRVFSDKKKVLQLMIDIKTDSVATLQVLTEKLNAYPNIANCKTIKLVISGNRPAVDNFESWPPNIYFDGELALNYPRPAARRIVMLSDNFRRYSTWNGLGTIPPADDQALRIMVKKARRLHKTVRFWNAPDNINSWIYFMQLGVDFINTDHIAQATNFLNEHLAK